jgi:hypothetical protein
MIKTMKKGDEMMEFLARYVRKVHSDRYIKNALKQDPGTSFLDIICPSDIAYVICLLINSHEIWIDALNNKNKDGNKQGKKEKKKPLFTAGEGKKRVFGECMWNEDGKNAYVYALRNWQKAYDPKEPQYKMLRDEWEQWVSTKAQSMVLGTWTKKTITSVLATRTEEEEVSSVKGTNSDEEEDGVGVDDGIEYDTDSDNRPMYNSGKWKNTSGANTGRAATNDDDDDDASVEAGVAPAVAASVNNLDPLNWDKESGDEDNDESDDKSKNDANEQGKDSESDDDDGGTMNDIIHSLTDVAAGRRTTTTTMKGAKAGTKKAAMTRTATVAEPTSRKRKATGSSGADEQARKGLRQRREKKWEE